MWQSVAPNWHIKGWSWMQVVYACTNEALPHFAKSIVKPSQRIRSLHARERSERGRTIRWRENPQWIRSRTSIIAHFPHFKVILWLILSTHIKFSSYYSIFLQSTSIQLLQLVLQACGICAVDICKSNQYGHWQAPSCRHDRDWNGLSQTM